MEYSGANRDLVPKNMVQPPLGSWSGEVRASATALLCHVLRTLLVFVSSQESVSPRATNLDNSEMMRWES